MATVVWMFAVLLDHLCLKQGHNGLANNEEHYSKIFGAKVTRDLPSVYGIKHYMCD